MLLPNHGCNENILLVSSTNTWLQAAMMSSSGAHFTILSHLQHMICCFGKLALKARSREIDLAELCWLSPNFTAVGDTAGACWSCWHFTMAANWWLELELENCLFDKKKIQTWHNITQSTWQYDSMTDLKFLCAPDRRPSRKLVKQCSCFVTIIALIENSFDWKSQIKPNICSSVDMNHFITLCQLTIHDPHPAVLG